MIRQHQKPGLTIELRAFTPLRMLVPSRSRIQTQECMSIVLQHIRSSLYFQGPGTWARELHDAFDFGHSQCAIEYSRQFRPTGVQAIVVFIDSDRVETHTFPIESLTQMPAVATAG